MTDQKVLDQKVLDQTALDQGVRYVRSPHLEVEHSSGDEAVLVHTLLGNRLKLNRATQRFLELFEQPRSLDDLAALGPVERALPTLNRLRRASFLCEEGHQQTLSDKIIQRMRPGFFGAPSAAEEDIDADAVLVGVPFDLGNHKGAGSRGGPDALRRMSLSDFRHYRLDAESGEPQGCFDNDLGRQILRGVRLADAGDLFVAPNQSPKSVFDNLRWVVGDILSDGALPVLIGGDHSITYAAIDSYRQPLSIIQIDAHADLAAYYEGSEHHHGNFMTRALRLEHVQAVHQIGIRGTCMRDQTRSGGKIASVTTPRSLRRGGVRAIVEELPAEHDYYVTFDIDVLDPSIAPGTTTPVPGGLMFDEAKELLLAIGSQRRCLGIDIVEVNPQRDAGGLTVMTAIELLLAFLGAHFEQRRLQRVTSGAEASQPREMEHALVAS